MKTVLALLTAVACLAPAQDPPPAVTGVWAVAVAGAERAMRFSLFVAAEGKNLSATLVGPTGERHPATIVIRGDAVTIRWATDDPRPVRVVMTGTLDGDQMKGSVDFVGQMKTDWTATRRARGGEVPIWGNVRDIYSRDTPVAGATVVITERLTGTASSLTTDGAGRFFVESARPGLYAIQIAAPGYGALTIRNLCVAQSEPAVVHAALGPSRGGDGVPGPVEPPAGEPHVYAPRSTPAAGTLSPTDIERAMGLGRKARSVKPPKLGGRALVLSPAWRVVSMTQVADAGGTAFEPAGAPRAFLENLAWIVGLPRSAYQNDGGTGPEHLAGVSDIVIQPRDGQAASGEIPPAWKMYLGNECEVEMLAKVLGPHFERPALLAAFPTDALAPGATVVLTYSAAATSRDGGRTISVPRKIERIVIRQKDVDSWK